MTLNDSIQCLLDIPSNLIKQKCTSPSLPSQHALYHPNDTEIAVNNRLNCRNGNVIRKNLSLTYIFTIVYLILVNRAYGQTNDGVRTTSNNSKKCGLDTEVGVIISIIYAVSSLIAMIVLSYSSFRQMSVFDMKTFGQDLWNKKKCFFPFIANVFDQSSDIGVIISLYLMSEYENKSNDNDCHGINATYLFYVSIIFLLLYRVVSGIAVFVCTYNVKFCFGQFICEFMIYRAIWVNYVLECDEPCSPQKWLQNMEAMLEAFPQLIIQMFFLIQTTEIDNNSSVDIFGTQLFVLCSIIFSILSLTNKAVSEDKPLFEAEKWKKTKCTCKPPFIKNPQYLIRVMFRILDVSSRIILIVLVWSIFGGFILLIVAAIEFVFLIGLAIYERDQTPLTWIATLPISFYGNLKCIHFIVAICRFMQHLAFTVLIYIEINNQDNNNNNSIKLSLSYYSLVAFICNFLFYVYIVLYKKVTTKIPASTNRTLEEMVKLKLYAEIHQMLKFGYIYKKENNINSEKILIYDDGDASLVFAFKNEFNTILKELIQGDLFINEKGNFGDTPLVFAIRKGHLDFATQLLSANANINEANNNGDTALILASRKGLNNIVLKLIEKNANIKAKNNTGMTGLMYASMNGHHRVSMQLINASAHINEKDNDGNTPLMFAAKYGHQKIVSQLIKAGANTNEKNNNNDTALRLASKYYRHDVVKQLGGQKYQSNMFLHGMHMHKYLHAQRGYSRQYN